MNHSLKKLPKGQIELLVETTSEEFLNYFNQATKEFSQEVRLNGFRPGKVPTDILRKRIGDDQITHRAAEKAIQDTYYQVLVKEKLATLDAPRIDILKQALNNPFVYKAVIDILPEVKLGDYKKIKVNKKPVKITEEEIEKILKNIQKTRAKEVLADRPARKGDKTELDINVYLDKIPLDGGAAKNQPIVIGEGNFIPGFEDQLIGLKKGDEKEFLLRFPKTYFQKHLADREAEFKVKVNSVFSLELPDLNDEFVKSLGYFQTLSELKDQIKKNLEQEAEEKEKQRLELAILEEIAKNSEFEEFPEILITQEIDKMMDELKHDFERQNLKFEDYLTSIKKSEEELKKGFEPQAEKRIKTALIIRKVAELEKIEISEEELKKELEAEKKAHEHNQEMLKRVDTADFKNLLRNILINRKVLALLEKIAVVE